MRSNLFIVTAVFSCSLATSWVLVGHADEPKQEALTAQQILDRVAKTYATCKTYRDTGIVKSRFIGPDVNFEVEKPFTTAFVRPDRLRFEYKEIRRDGREYRYIVWRSGEEIRSWWDVAPGVKKPDSLAVALAEATGVSGGSAHTVPALLLPKEIPGWRLTDMTEAKRIGDDKYGKSDCFRVEGKTAEYPVTLWIDKETFLVRKIDSPKKIKAPSQTLLNIMVNAT
jgi:hypothetical protein